MCIPTIYRSRQQESLPDIRKQFQMQTIQNVYSPYRNMCITTSHLTSWFYSDVQKHSECAKTSRSPVFSVFLDWICHTHTCGAKKGGVGVGVTNWSVTNSRIECVHWIFNYEQQTADILRMFYIKRRVCDDRSLIYSSTQQDRKGIWIYFAN